MEATQIWPATGIADLEADIGSLSASEIPGIKAVWADQRERLKDSVQLSDFTEKLSREWAIETGIIENLYDIERCVTETLIEHGFQAELLSHDSTNGPREFVISLLRDQKNALDGIFDFVKSERTLSVSYIKELHAALLRSQVTTDARDAQGKDMQVQLVKGDWKTQPNSPHRNGDVFHYCPPEQTASEMDCLIAMHDKQISRDVPSEVRAAWLHHRFTQIHPFQDGNGRVARALASLVLIKDGLFPMVVTRDDRQAYIGALETADQGNLQPLISLIVKWQITQFRKATAISESMGLDDSVQAALDHLNQTAERAAAERLKELRGVIDLAHQLEANLKNRLEKITPDVESALQKLHGNVNVHAAQSSPKTDFWFHKQIIENARDHLGYFADTREHRSWVSLVMIWSRRSRLVFTFHGIGRPFNGSLICAPFLEFRDKDDEGNTQTSFVPAADEGFVFFYNEAEEGLMKRFDPWCEKVLSVALNELTRNIG